MSVGSNSRNMAAHDYISPIVIDIGSGSIKAGYAGDPEPTTLIPTIVGRSQFGDPSNKEVYVGDGALVNSGVLRLKYPIERGLVTDWDAMEGLFHDTYGYLRVPPEDQPVLLSDRPFSPKSQKETMTQLMFETFKVPGMYLAIQEFMHLCSSGRTIGVVATCGEGMSYSIPFYEGSELSYASRWLELGGSDLTDWLANMLQSKGYGYGLSSSDKERRWVRDMKEKLGYVAIDYDRELVYAARKPYGIDKNYKLPDGQVISIGAERFTCPEVLFQPHLIDREADGIHEIINDSIKKCSGGVREYLYGNITLCGGSTMFPGLTGRLTKEIESLVAPSSVKIRVVGPPDKYSVWCGGSILASLSSFQQRMISKSEYDESGPSIVHRKCVSHRF